MVTVLSGDSVQKGTVDFSLKKLCHLSFPPFPCCDMALIGLFLLWQEKARRGGLGTREGGRAGLAEPIAVCRVAAIGVLQQAVIRWMCTSGDPWPAVAPV